MHAISSSSCYWINQALNPGPLIALSVQICMVTVAARDVLKNVHVCRRLIYLYNLYGRILLSTIIIYMPIYGSYIEIEFISS